MLKLLTNSGRSSAYGALAVLTLMWGTNWIALKLGVDHGHPVTFNIERILAAIALLFTVIIVRRRPLWPESWAAVVVTGFFQTTLNFGATTMAVATGGIGRTAVLVFIMPFWTMLLAWPILGERVRGIQWLAVALALAGLALVVAPWDWRGDLEPKLWATLSGSSWAAGSVATAYFQRRRRLDGLNLITWQMVIGVIPLALIPLVWPVPATPWTLPYVASLVYAGAIATGIGFILWTAILAALPAGTASLNMLAIPVIALVSGLVIFSEPVAPHEWLGIAAIGAGLAIISLRAARGG
jgi:drug/metabolite transporter (DMT)-like permease